MVGNDKDVAQEKSPLLLRVGKERGRARALRESDRSLSQKIYEKLSSSAREHALRNLGIGPSAYLIRDAVLGETKSPYEAWYDPYANPDKPAINFISILCGRLLAYQWTVRFLKASAWMMVILTFIEPPNWCRDSILDDPSLDERYSDCQSLLSMRGTAVDGDENVLYYPNSSSMMLSIEQAVKVETACLAIISIFLLFRLGRDGFELRRFFYKGYNRWIHGLQCGLTAALVVGLATRNNYCNPFLRLVLLGTYLKNLQKELRCLLKMLPQVVYILALLGILIVFYGWFGVVIFYGTEQGKRDFPNLIEGCWTLWICLTTANYPDVMMPSYNDNRLSGIFFVSFMVISFFFLMNLILASVVNAYDEGIDERKKSRKRIATENLAKAFELMDPRNTGRIDRETIMALFLILNEDFPEIRSLSNDETKLIFGLLDRDGSSTITMDEFDEFGNVLLVEFTKESDYKTFVELHFPKLFRSERYQSLCKMVRSTTFEYIVDIILLLNAVVISIQSYSELSGQAIELDPHYSDGYVDTIWELMETIFTALYLIELILKILVDGWKKYKESPRNVFDFVVTISAVIATGYVYYPNAYSDSRLIRYIVMARVLRLSRLLVSIRSFQTIGIVSAEILPAATSVILLLLFLMYSFAWLGVMLYGGVITRDPSNPRSLPVLGTDFSDNDYWANNFNDMLSGMNVLFNLLVVNNWTNCEIGFEAATGGKMVRFFFFSFHILGVVFVNNLVIAFIINAFFQQLATINSRHSEAVVEGEAVIQGERAMFDASEITGTKTGTSGGYIARIRTVHADVEVDEQEGLKRLFTQSSTSSIEQNGKKVELA